MKAVRMSNLEERTRQLVREVRERGEEVALTEDGELVARLVPASAAATLDARTNAAWSELEALAVRIGAKWPKGVTAEEAIRDVRREL